MQVYAPISLPWKAIKLWPGNPRATSSKDKADIKASLRRWNMASIGTVWMPEQILIGGNQRQLALFALEADGEKIPAEFWYVPFEGERDKAAQLNLALNKIQAAFDPAKLSSMFADLSKRHSASELAVTGFDAYEVKLLQDATLESAERVLSGAAEAFRAVGDKASVAEVRAALVRGGMDLTSADLLAPVYVAAGQAPNWAQLQKQKEDDGSGADEDGMYTIKLQVSPEAMLKYKKRMLRASGKTDEEKFMGVLAIVLAALKLPLVAPEKSTTHTDEMLDAAARQMASDVIHITQGADYRAPEQKEQKEQKDTK